ncbi:glycosyltransferase family 4 protein [Sphingobium sp. RSMS]|uniref:glycosyltransferase family 4 protein n=1 Tax=Sphingobium sp. RSMS TaxID=520734 RepID=UPI0010F76DDF|nr:glycosyltransferase family 1 protein [Sphingobium sp. RSMS]UXC89776.1 glycosyltransferase family 4 protein [Sphingobium sp. RSMS]
MKIITDGYNMALPHGTGVATYGRAFLRAVRGLGHESHLLFGEETSQASRSLTPLGRELRKIADFVRAPLGFHPARADGVLAVERDRYPPVDAVWNRSRLFRAAKGAFRRTGRFTPVHIPGIDIAHWTYPLPLFVRGARNIYTIHDLVPLLFPAMVKNGVEEYRNICAAIARRGEHIVTVSECSRRDIIAMFDVAEEQVTNSYQPFDPADTATLPPDPVLDRWKLVDKGYFLFFGAIEPKKNVGRLLDAYLRSGVNTPLLVVAAGGWGCEAERRRLEALARDPLSGVILQDYLPRKALVELIRRARATLFPSLYEGFGLPVLESMALGTAVVASDVSALPEIVGKAGLLVDPQSIDSISQAIRLIDGDPDGRRDREREGLEQAGRFSPEQYQARIANLFARLS